MMTHNRLTSGFRMMQRRGKRIDCPLREEWKPFAPECTGRTYIEGTFGNVATEDFRGQAEGGDANNPVYKYMEFDIGAGIREGGYFELFRDDPSECQRIDELKHQRWIDKFTEYYRLDFVVYNPNVGLFASVNFKIEFDNTGLLIPEYYSETLSSTIYSSWTDIVRLGLEIVIVIWWLCKVLSHGYHARDKARREGRLFAYFDVPLNGLVVAQLLLYAIIFITWGLIASNPIRSNLRVTSDSILTPEETMPNFQGLVILSQIYFVLCGVNCLAIMVMILSFLRINANLSQLTDTFIFMMGDLLQFGIILMLLVLGFVLMSHVLFGTSLAEYSTISSCLVTIFEMLMGGGDYFMLAEVDPIAAPIFFFPFVFIMLFVTLNITIAVIMDGYTTMQHSRQEARKSFFAEFVDLAFADQVFHGFLRMFSFANTLFPRRWKEIKTKNGQVLSRFSCASGDEILNLFRELEEELENQLVPIDELKIMLKDKNISGERLEAIFDRYNAWGHVQAIAEEDADESFGFRMLPHLLSVKEVLNSIQHEQQVLESKIEHIITAFPT